MAPFGPPAHAISRGTLCYAYVALPHQACWLRGPARRGEARGGAGVRPPNARTGGRAFLAPGRSTTGLLECNAGPARHSTAAVCKVLYIPAHAFGTDNCWTGTECNVRARTRYLPYLACSGCRCMPASAGVCDAVAAKAGSSWLASPRIPPPPGPSMHTLDAAVQKNNLGASASCILRMQHES